MAIKYVSSKREGSREREREMEKGRFCYGEVVPFTVMVMVECSNVGSSTLYKAATLKGMSYCVFIFYSYSVATLVLLPVAFVSHRRTTLPPFDKSLMVRFCLIGIIGLTSLLLGYKGIEYASPTLNSALSNLTPACTFILAIIFRMEKLALRSWRTQAKISGTIVLISGAFVVILYKGPSITRTLSPSITYNQVPTSSSQSNWVVGGLFFAVDYAMVAVWYIVQARIVRKYPAEFVVVFLINLCISIFSIPACLILQPNLSAWRIQEATPLLSILFSGVAGSAIGGAVHSWGLKAKGPVYVALFRPLSIPIAALMGVIFLGETLHLGSVVGSIIISIGFYVVMWGKANEERDEEDNGVSRLESPSPETVPMLQHETEQTRTPYDVI